MVGARFVPIAEAVKDLAAYESWSRFCLEQLDVLLAKGGVWSCRSDNEFRLTQESREEREGV